MGGAEERGVNGVASMSSIGRHGINGRGKLERKFM
jgi:hypothetical protein